MHSSRRLLYVTVVLGTCIGCEGLLGLNDYRVGTQRPMPQAEEACNTQQDCVVAGAGNETEPQRLCTPEHRCVSPQTEQCKVLTKPVHDARALVLGSVFSTSASTYDTARQNAVVLAVDEINDRGGVPGPAAAPARKLILVSCDGSKGAEVAAQQLVKLGAVALVGPSDDDAVVNVSTKQTIAAGTLLISPSALITRSSSAAPAMDNDLSWGMSPTVEQRAPLLKLLLATLEHQLSGDDAQRTQELKLGVVFEDDAVGRASIASLDQHKFAGETLSATGAKSGRIRIDRYPTEPADRAALIAAYRAFAPDVIVLLGDNQLVTEWMAPLERSYEVAADGAKDARPYYVITEPQKSPELLMLAQQVAGLRTRVRGVSATPTDRSRPVFEGFQNRFEARFGLGGAAVPGAGSAYDALYAIAYALSSIDAEPVTGARIASALHWLSDGSDLVAVGTAEMSTAFRKLSSHERVAALGTMSELRWDDAGAARAGALEVFCLSIGDDPLGFVSSGLRWDIAAEQAAGSFSGCGARGASATDGVKTGVPAMDTSAGHLDQTPPDGSSPTAPDMGMGMDPAQPAAGSGSDGAHDGGGAGGAGRGGAGGAAGSGGSAGGAPPASMPQRTDLSCGDRRTCRLDRGEHCCIAELRPVTGPLPSDLSCRSAPVAIGAAGSGAGGSGGTCTLSLYCSSDRECADGQVCCADDTSARCASPQECMQKMHRRLECALPQDCPSGTQCCIRTEQNLAAFSSTTCEARCSVQAGSGTVCQRDEDCPTDGTSRLVCNQSYVLPSLRVCWPAQ